MLEILAYICIIPGGTLLAIGLDQLQRKYIKWRDK